jgi:hypothetical protein
MSSQDPHQVRGSTERSGDPPAHIAGKPVLAPARSRRAGALPLRAEVSDGVPLRESEPEIASRPPDRKHSNTDLGSARNKLLFGRPVAFRPHGGLLKENARSQLHRDREHQQDRCAESAHHGEWNDVLAAVFHLDLSRIGVCLGRRLTSARFWGTKKDFCSIGAGMKVTEVESRSSLRRMALAWADPADQAERNSRSDVVYEPPERERRQG